MNCNWLTLLKACFSRTGTTTEVDVDVDTVDFDGFGEFSELVIQLGVDSSGPTQPRIRWECIVAPSGEYNSSICAAAAMRAVAIITVATYCSSPKYMYDSEYTCMLKADW